MMFGYKNRNLKNINDLEELKDLQLYRVMKTDHLMKWISTGKNSLVCVDNWDDPWEKALFKQRIVSDGGAYTLSRFRYFGQCWSMNKKETDTIWRTYNARGANCVRVEVNAFDLCNSFMNYIDKVSGHQDLSRLLCYCGKVRYLTERTAKKYFESKTIEGLVATKSFEDTLFVKRNGFCLENEFRLVYFYTDISNLKDVNVSAVSPNNGLISFDMDVSHIQSVLFGPKISSKYEDYVKHKNSFRRFEKKLWKLGITNVSRSTLYDFPELEIKEL
jgi:hypothetical protein